MADHSKEPSKSSFLKMKKKGRESVTNNSVAGVVSFETAFSRPPTTAGIKRSSQLVRGMKLSPTGRFLEAQQCSANMLSRRSDLVTSPHQASRVMHKPPIVPRVTTNTRGITTGNSTRDKIQKYWRDYPVARSPSSSSSSSSFSSSYNLRSTVDKGASSRRDQNTFDSGFSNMFNDFYSRTPGGAVGRPVASNYNLRASLALRASSKYDMCGGDSRSFYSRNVNLSQQNAARPSSRKNSSSLAKEMPSSNSSSSGAAVSDVSDNNFIGFSEDVNLKNKMKQFNKLSQDRNNSPGTDVQGAGARPKTKNVQRAMTAEGVKVSCTTRCRRSNAQHYINITLNKILAAKQSNLQLQLEKLVLINNTLTRLQDEGRIVSRNGTFIAKK